MLPYTLSDFVRESNRIEGIHRDPTPEEIEAHAVMLARPTLSIETLCDFVKICAGPDHVLRDRTGLNVRVGNHIAPPGGSAIRDRLETLLAVASKGMVAAYTAHLAYETLHPFTDGNGRSGRAVWLWQMGGIERAPLGFLHHWYYQTLEFGSGRAALAESGRT